MWIGDAAPRGRGQAAVCSRANTFVSRALIGAALALTTAGCGGAGTDERPLDAPLLAPAPDPVRDPAAPPLALADAAARVPDTAPGPSAGAPCGYVDTMDTPLGPPDGQGFQVRWPFGRVSNRYDGKLHAGEDWLALAGNSFGQPLHAIAHGEVAYAQPWGWGTDQGVIIVRHRFPPGRVDDEGRPLTSILSFYGHVDPPSVTVVAGQCVVRGQRIAAIGKPRGRAHLHFEIRTHMPDTPGPGYWPTDPTRVGWRSPSAFMTTYRLRSTPGVRWLAPYTPTLTAALGRAADGRLVVHTEGRVLTGVDVGDGQAAWHIVVDGPILQAALDAAGAVAYVAQPRGISAYAIDAATPAIWHQSTADRPVLLALREGGVAVAADGALRAFGSDGAEHWRVDGVGNVTALAASDRWLVLAGAGTAGAWPSPASGRTIVRPGLAGTPAVAGDGVFFHAPDGVTWLSLVAPEPPRIHALAAGRLDDGQIVALDDGGALVAHRGPDVRRLIRFGPDGTPVWERDVSVLGRRLPRLVVTSQGPFAVGAGGDIVAIDLSTGAATRRFAGIQAEGLVDVPWAAALDDGTVISRLPLRDGQLVAFEAGATVARR